MTLNDIIAKRRSVRAYQMRPVDGALIEQVLEAGRLAPSARNTGAWHVTVVANAAMRRALVEACCGQAMVGQAGAVLVVWTQNAGLMTNEQPAGTIDCAIAMTHMLLKATELGLGTCWLGAYHAPRVQGLLDLPADARVVAVSPLGWPAESPAPRPRKPLREMSDIRD